MHVVRVLHIGRGALVGAAVILSSWAGGLEAQQPFRLQGFSTFELEGSDRDEEGRRWTFDQHQFNLIAIFELDQSWRALSEMEWEHGIDLGGPDGSGEVKLVRSWIEFRQSDALQVRVGKYLPPFGLYNLLHDASPTFLMTFLPGPLYGKHANPAGELQRLYPKFATGIQLLGRAFTGSVSAKYYLYVSNGRGANPGEQDDNRNKGIGARVVVASLGQAVQVGASAYQDRNGLAADTRQGSFAADLRLKVGRYQLDSEYLLPRLERVDESGAPNGTFRVGRGFYVQGSRSVREVVTPFLRYESYDADTGATGDRESAIVAGINLSLTSSVYLKGETHFRGFEASDTPSYRLHAFSLAVAF